MRAIPEQVPYPGAYPGAAHDAPLEFGVDPSGRAVTMPATAHVLVVGPAGCGKNQTAAVVADLYAARPHVRLLVGGGLWKSQSQVASWVDEVVVGPSEAEAMDGLDDILGAIGARPVAAHTVVILDHPPLGFASVRARVTELMDWLEWSGQVVLTTGRPAAETRQVWERCRTRIGFGWAATEYRTALGVRGRVPRPVRERVPGWFAGMTPGGPVAGQVYSKPDTDRVPERVATLAA